MVKYRLRLKGGEIIDKQDKEKCGIFIYGARGEYLAYYDDEYSFCECGSACYNDNESKFNQNDIDKIPSGLLKKLDVIEVKEQLYYIKMPVFSISNNFLNQEKDGTVTLGNHKNTNQFRTRFTKSEIEEKFPMYANDYFMVMVEDIK